MQYGNTTKNILFSHLLMLLYWIYPIRLLVIFNNGVKYTIEKTEWQSRRDTPETQATLKTSQRTKQKPTEHQNVEQHGSHHNTW